MKVIGHRGWPTKYPDNVLEGIAAALEVADMVEVDVRKSGDGCLILSHDAVLGGMVVSEAAWADLARVDLGRGFHPASLDQVLEEFPTSRFNFEVKNTPAEPGFDPDHGSALETAAVARPGDLLSCFFWPTMDAVRNSFPNVATGLLVDADGYLDSAVDHALAKGHLAVIAQWELALGSAHTCRRGADAGLTMAVWTLNDPSKVPELASIGVTAIITDDPGEMRRAVDRDQEPPWQPSKNNLQQN
jgi:glycerophosphoryl diester phosphodiesterase